METVHFGDAYVGVEPQTEPENMGEEMKKIKASPFDADFAKLAEDTLVKWHLPGVALAVVDGDETFAEVFIQGKISYRQGTSKFAHRDTALPPYLMCLSDRPLSSAQEVPQSHLRPPQRLCWSTTRTNTPTSNGTPR